MDREVVLFSERLGTQRIRVWLERRGAGIGLLSHDMGPGLEQAFGSDEIETFLVIEVRERGRLTAALVAERIDPDPPTVAIALLADKYAGKSTATTDLRTWLTERGIPHEFSVV